MGTVATLRAAWTAAFNPEPDVAPPPPAAPEQRAAERHQALLSAEVLFAGCAYKAQIRNISTGGLTLAFSNMPSLFKGAHLLVRAPGFAPISGTVRWFNGEECGMALNIALAEEALEDVAALFDPGKRPRPARAKLSLNAAARVDGRSRPVTIENIGPGGALISSGLPITIGRALMLEIDGLLPIGGHVRWTKNGRSGVMFSKLLPIATAEEIAARCSLHPSWLREVAAAHEALS